MVVIGSTQTGKSSSALSFLQAQPGIKIFINTKREAKWFDTDKEFDDTRCVKYQIYTPYNLDHMYNHYDVFSDHIAQIVPSATNKSAIGDIEEILDAILRIHQDNIQAKKIKNMRTTVCVDEIQVFQNAHSCNDTLMRLWVMGHGLGIRCIAIAQRPQMIHFTLLANSEIWVVHATEPSDLTYLRRDKGVLHYDVEKPPTFKKPRKYPFISHDRYIQTNKLTGLVKLT